MKKTILLITMLITMIFGMNASASTFGENTVKEESKMCTLFTKKADTYKLTMRDDAYAKATLKSYETRAKHYCSKQS